MYKFIISPGLVIVRLVSVLTDDTPEETTVRARLVASRVSIIRIIGIRSISLHGLLLAGVGKLERWMKETSM
jgi:hypothetical protein